MSDTRMNWARGPRILPAISIGTIVASLLTPIAFLFGTFPGVGSAALMFLGYFVLRGATRGLAEIPAEYLDERELALRNAIYVRSYQALAGVIAAVTIALFIFAVFSDALDQKVILTLNFDQVQACVWLLLGPITIIPTVSLALSKTK